MKQDRQKAPKQLKMLQKKLKSLTTKWADIIVEEMSKTSPTNKIKLYNILNGSVKDRKWHNIFISAANKVIIRLEKEQQKIRA